MSDLYAWRQGIYMMDAIGHCFSESCPYPDRPYSMECEQEKGLPSDVSPVKDTNRAMIDAQIVKVQSIFKKKQKK